MTLADRIQHDRDVAGVEPRPLTVVTPFGRTCEGEIRSAFDRIEVSVVGEARLTDWSRIGSALYVRRFDPERLLIAAAYEDAWRRFPDDAAIWFLDGIESFTRLSTSKHAIREALPSSEKTVDYEGRTIAVDLHAFHVPDLDQLGYELAILERFLSGHPGR